MCMAWRFAFPIRNYDFNTLFSLQINPIKNGIGLYRDVWIAAIASSRTRLATLSGVMCNTSQCELRSLCVNSGMLNVIRIAPVRVANLVLDCNGIFALKGLL